MDLRVHQLLFACQNNPKAKLLLSSFPDLRNSIHGHKRWERLCAGRMSDSVGAASVAPVPSVDAKAKAFTEWAALAGVEFPKLSLATFDGVRGMMATEKIEEDEITASFPRDLAIALEPRAACPEWCDKDLWSSGPWFLKLALLLLREKTQGAESRVRGYVESLPDALDTPIEWNDAERARLQYPPILVAIKQQKEEWDNLYRRIKESNDLLLPVDSHEFRWALGCVRSRSFSGPYIGSTLPDRLKVVGAVGLLAWGNVVFGSGSVEQTLNAVIAVALFNILYELLLSRMAKVYLLCPGVDLMNHNCKVETDLSYDYFRDEYNVRASEIYLKGDQVFISYGHQSNDSLMQFYGFCEQENPYDVYIMSDMARWLSLHPLLKKSRLEIEKLECLKALKDVKITRDGFPELTRNALRGVLAAIGETEKNIEGELKSLLIHSCAKELDSLGTSLDADLAELQEITGDDFRHRWALRFRIEKKRLLLACLQNLQ